MERVFELFPRLAERQGSGGRLDVGGEQQMLAIGRALMSAAARDAARRAVDGARTDAHHPDLRHHHRDQQPGHHGAARRAERRAGAAARPSRLCAGDRPGGEGGPRATTCSTIQPCRPRTSAVPEPHGRLATAAVLTSAALFGTTGTCSSGGGAGAESVGPAAARDRRSSAGGGRSARFAVGSVAPVVVTARLVGVAVFQLGYFLSVERTGVAVGTGHHHRLGAGARRADRRGVADRRDVGPSPVMDRRSSTRSCRGGLLLAGVSAEADTAGIALALCAGLGWATFATVGKHQIDSGVESTASMAAMFTGSLCCPPLLAGHPAGSPTADGWWIALVACASGWSP